MQLERIGVNQYHGMRLMCDPGPEGAERPASGGLIGAILALGVIGGLGYYIYRTKKGQATAGQGEEQPSNPQ